MIALLSVTANLTMYEVVYAHFATMVVFYFKFANSLGSGTRQMYLTNPLIQRVWEELEGILWLLKINSELQKIKGFLVSSDGGFQSNSGAS
jgi:hypothetical protein